MKGEVRGEGECDWSGSVVSDTAAVERLRREPGYLCRIGKNGAPGDPCRRKYRVR